MGVHNVTHLKTTSFPFPIVWAESQADIHGKDVPGEADRESGGLKRRGGPPLRLAASSLRGQVPAHGPIPRQENARRAYCRWKALLLRGPAPARVRAEQVLPELRQGVRAAAWLWGQAFWHSPPQTGGCGAPVRRLRGSGPLRWVIRSDRQRVTSPLLRQGAGGAGRRQARQWGGQRVSADGPVEGEDQVGENGA